MKLMSPRLANPFKRSTESFPAFVEHNLVARPPFDPYRTTDLPWRKCLLALAALGAVVSLILIVLTSTRSTDPAPFVFLEIRAIDAGGHPVAGATVELGGERQGVTDSFGEWRRYLRLTLGSEVSLVLRKTTPRGALKAVRVLSVPADLPREGEPEVRASIQLVPGPRGERAEDTRRRPTRVAPVPTRSAPVERRTESIDAGAEGEMERQLAMVDNLTSIGLSYEPTQLAGLGSFHDYQARQMEGALFAELKTQAMAAGLKLDPSSDWQMTLRYIPVDHQTGFIAADLTWLDIGQPAETSFLRNMNGRIPDLARSLLTTAKMHVGKLYAALRDGDNWYAQPSGRAEAFWRIGPGTVLTDRFGQSFPITMEKTSDGRERLRLMTQGAAPCRAADATRHCLLVTPTVQRKPPLAGWEDLRFTLDGQLTAADRVYVSGYLARPDGARSFRYWGASGADSNLTVVRGNRIIARQRFKDRGGQATVLAIPALQVARR